MVNQQLHFILLLQYFLHLVALAVTGICSVLNSICYSSGKAELQGGAVYMTELQDIRNSVIFRSSWRGQSSLWLNLTSVHHWKQFSQQLFILCSVAFNPYFWPSCHALHTLLSLGSAMLTKTESETFNKAVNTLVLL